jgi:MFS family permease
MVAGAVGGDVTGRPLWRRRDVRIAWTAAFVNDTGDWILAVGLPVFVFVETRSGATTALLFVFQLVAGALLGPVGGAIVDRVDLRRCLVATNLAQAVTILPLLAVTADRIWPAYVVIVVQAALTQVNNPANVALLPRLVEPDELASANAALGAASSLARLIGAPVGGLLVGWRGLEPIVLLDATSFALVATAVLFVRADTSPIRHDGDEHVGRDLRGGWRAVRGNPPLTEMFGLHGCSQVAQGAFVVLFVAFVVETLDDDGSGLGLIRGTMAIGALTGAAVIASVAGRVDPPVLYACGLVGMGVVSLAFWNAPSVTTALWVYVVLFAMSGLPGSAMSVGFVTTVQRASPSYALGRVSGLMGAADAAGTAAGSILTGLLIDHVALRPLVNAQAMIYVVSGAVALWLFAGRRSVASTRP